MGAASAGRELEQIFGVCWGGRTLLGWVGSPQGDGEGNSAGLIPAPPTEIREAFKVFDRDGNGFISKQELGTAMRSLGYMPNEVELEVIIQRLDMDGRSRAGDRDGTAAGRNTQFCISTPHAGHDTGCEMSLTQALPLAAASRSSIIIIIATAAFFGKI